MRKIDSRYLSPEERTSIFNRLRADMEEYANINDDAAAISNSIIPEAHVARLDRLSEFENSRLNPREYVNSKYRPIREEAERVNSLQDIEGLRHRITDNLNSAHVAGNNLIELNNLYFSLDRPHTVREIDEILNRVEQLRPGVERYLFQSHLPMNTFRSIALKGQKARQNTLISDIAYDPNNLPQKFIDADVLIGDIKEAAYFNMSPKGAFAKATRDFQNLRHGQAWALTEDFATSTDSYPLQLAMMRRKQNEGMIKVLSDKTGEPKYMWLNRYGKRSMEEAIPIINSNLNQIGKIIGVDGLTVRKTADDAVLEVPQIIFRKYADGGDVEPDNSVARVNPYTGQPIASGRINNAFSLRTLLDFTPIGDALSIKDIVSALSDGDWLGAGMIAAGLFPFIPSVNRKAIQEATDRAIRQVEKKDAVLDEFYNQRNGVIESLIENEDAFRRAANADISSNANYLGTYQNMLNSYLADPSRLNSTLPRAQFDPNLYATEIKAQVNPNDLSTITLNPRYYDVDEVDASFQQLNPGLVRHEIGHQVDVQSGLDYTDRLSNPEKFVSDEELKDLYPKSYKALRRDVLNRGSEIKSYMNEFRDYVNAKEGLWNTNITPKSFQRKLDKYRDKFPTLYKIFNSYKSKKEFIKDFNSIPIVSTNRKEDLA